jgi:hypothetical protein
VHLRPETTCEGKALIGAFILGEHCDQVLAGGVLHADISTSVSVRYKHIRGQRN